MLDKFKQIKYSRLSEEERFFLDTIDGIEPFTSDKYPQSIFWKKNDIILLEQDYKQKWLRVNNELIWSVLYNKYGYNNTSIQIFIKDVVEKHTNFGILTPHLQILWQESLMGRYTDL